MKKKQLNRLLNTACELLSQLEDSASDEQKKGINSVFNEIKYSDRIDDEMKEDVDEFPINQIK
jgi:hypothetical protein